MAFFKPKPPATPPPPVDDAARRYFAAAPPGPRVFGLAASCAHHVGGLATSQAEQLGTPITMEAVVAPTAVVEHLLRQDRDLSPYVARRSVMQLDALCTGGLAGEWGPNLDEMFSAAGLAIAQSVHVIPERVGSLSEVEQDGASGLGTVVLELLMTSTSSPQERSAGRAAFYSDLFKAPPGSENERRALQITAWAGTAIGRLRAAGRIVGEHNFPKFFSPEYADLPAMEGEGWYPNPTNVGEVVNGEPLASRFWDGNAWTDELRLRHGRTWETGQAPLHVPPD